MNHCVRSTDLDQQMSFPDMLVILLKMTLKKYETAYFRHED